MQLLSYLSSVLKTCATILWRLWLRFPACIRRAVYGHIMDMCFCISFWDLEGGIYDNLPFGLRLTYCSADPPETEANNIKFVRKNTTIPGIPDVLDFVPDDPDTGLEMGIILTKEPKLEGVITLHDWLRARTMYPPEYYHYVSIIFGPPHLRGKRSCAELSDLALSFDKPFLDLSDSPPLIEDLRRALTELRSIIPPSLYQVSGAYGSPLLYERYGARRVLQPSSNIRSFHETILSEVAPKGHYFDAPKRIMKQHRLCFSHSNLTRENILVTGDGRLATIINWKAAGWFPDYWDYALVDKPVSLAEARVLNQFWTAVGVFGEGRYDENPEHYWD
ncbi:uncharacterized protein ARMOST_04594 [Armillaria ostoyae]|uniref:Aminoglycoside phosphotransferase domain-containing protein n=1 Tax=Armillaria ostoyae TaxID=47428 RepID=A0A284QXS0_ARMOS|nr:uncharacterized protein ARMOST_04594 [Armillaria ostoyae]